MYVQDYVFHVCIHLDNKVVCVCVCVFEIRTIIIICNFADCIDETKTDTTTKKTLSQKCRDAKPLLIE